MQAGYIAATTDRGAQVMEYVSGATDWINVFRNAILGMYRTPATGASVSSHGLHGHTRRNSMGTIAASLCRGNVAQAMKSVLLFIPAFMMLVGVQSAIAAKVLYVRTHASAFIAQDSLQALGYKALFDSLGHPTTIVRTDGVAGISLAQYDVIAISSGTGGAAGWAGDSATVAALKNSGKAVLALGNGGPAFLERLGLWSSWNQSAGTNTNGLIVTNAGHPIFTTPNPVTIPPDGNLVLVSADQGGEALYVAGGSPADVVLFGMGIGDPGYTPLALEKNRYFYWGLAAPAGSLTLSGKRLIGNVLTHLLTITSASGDLESGSSQRSENFTLQQNFPNPFNPSTTIRYGLPGRLHVRLTVFNPLGQQVALLQNGEQDAGYHEVRFDGGKLASGVYLYRIQAGSYAETKTLLLVR